MRRSLSALGLWDVLREELNKIPALLRFHANSTAYSTTRAFEFLKGVNNPNDTPEMAEKRRQHREAYEEIMRQQQQRARNAFKQELEKQSLATSLKMRAVNMFKALKEATSTSAGAMALLQHCTASHAAEVAVEEGIDVRNVTMVLEKTTTGTQVGYEKATVVGYVDAPNASEEEVMAFAEKLQKRCPLAKSMEGRIEWRSLGPTTSRTDNGNSHNIGSETSGSESILRGTPGMGRHVSSARKGHGYLHDDDELHLPENKKSGENAKDK